jgi:hypothetical protein
MIDGVGCFEASLIDGVSWVDIKNMKERVSIL